MAGQNPCMINLANQLYCLLSSFSFPVIFAEDAAPHLSEIPADFEPFEHFTKLDESRIDLCGGNNVDNVTITLKAMLANLGHAFLDDYFRKLSIHQV
jgi:hypothetical protein